MKHSFNNLIMIALMATSIFFGSCVKEEIVILAKKKVTLSYNLKKGIGEEQLKSADAVNPAAVIATILDESGNMVRNKQRLELTNSGTGFITEAPNLSPGTYQLSEYYVLDDANKVIYIAPKAGSPMASWVDKPLPITFEVLNGEVTELAPEVISVADGQPEDFGYATFSFNPVESFNFNIAVLAYNNESKAFEMVSAEVKVAGEDKVLATKNIPASVDAISLPDDVDSFIIKVEKEGYKAVSKTISNTELKKYIEGGEYGPLKIYLQNKDGSDAITLVTDQTTLKEVIVDMRVADYSDALHIDWGDGTPVIKPNVGGLKNNHAYSREGTYEIRILGNANNVTFLGASQCNITELDITSATNVTKLHLYNNEIKTIDLSGLNKLESISISGNDLSSIDVSNNPDLQWLDVMGNSLTSLDLSNNKKITVLSIIGNKFESIDLTSAVELTTFYCGRNSLLNIDVTKNIKLKTLSCGRNYELANLDVSQNIDLENLNLYGLRKITELNVSNNKKLKSLEISSTSITSIDISNNVELTSFNARNCFLTDIDVSNNTKLKYISFYAAFINENIINSFFIDLEKNVSEENILDGRLGAYLPTPTSPAAIKAKQDLVNTYNWTINE